MIYIPLQIFVQKKVPQIFADSLKSRTFAPVNKNSGV